MYEWDEPKRRSTLAARGVDFADMGRFDWSNATTAEDDRAHYGETRFVSVGRIDGRLHVCAWTLRRENIRIISLRKANAREKENYVRSTSANR